MANVPNGVKILRKISVAWVGCTNVTDRRQMDGRVISRSLMNDRIHAHDCTSTITTSKIVAYKQLVMRPCLITANCHSTSYFVLFFACLEWNFNVILSVAVAVVVQSLGVLRLKSPTTLRISSKTIIHLRGLAAMMMMMMMMMWDCWGWMQRQLLKGVRPQVAMQTMVMCSYYVR